MDAPDHPPSHSETSDRVRSEPPGETATIRLSWLPVIGVIGAIVGMIAVEIAFYLYFASLTGWPEAYGIECGRKCLPIFLFHSPRLLLKGDLSELGMFMAIWGFIWIPAVVLIPLSRQRSPRNRAD